MKSANLSSGLPAWAVAVASTLLIFVKGTISAAISVGPGGSGIITFETLPTAGDFATLSIPGDATSIRDVAALDAAIQTNTAAMITNRLQSSSANPPSASALAQWSSTGRYVQTRPEGNAATLLVAALRNDAGGCEMVTLELSYSLNVGSAGTEQLPGHRVYYSLSGMENSWLLILVLSGDNTAGSKVMTVDLRSTPWPPGALLYLLWADDNDGDLIDGGLQVDDFHVGIAQWDSFITHQPPPNTTVIQCRTASIAAGVEGPRPYRLWWLKEISPGNYQPIDTNANPTAATETLVITNAQFSDAGNYKLEFTSCSMMMESSAAALHIIEDTNGPVMLSARVNGDRSRVVVGWSEPLLPGANSSQDASKYAIVDDHDADIMDHSIVPELDPPGTNLTLFLRGSAWDEDALYRVVNFGGTPDRCEPLDLSSNHSIDVQIRLQPTLTISFDRLTSNITVSWSPAVGQLEQSSNLLNWTDSSRTNGAPTPPSGTSLFYRVRR